MSRFKRKDLPRFKRTDPPCSSSKKSTPAVCPAKSNNGNGNGNGNGWLTPSEKIFADEWLVDRNGTRAYKVAYPHIKKDPVAGVLACKRLKKGSVAAYIEKRLKKIAEKAEISQEWVLERYKRLADYHLTDFFSDDGQLKPLSEIPESALYAVCGFKSLNNKSVKQLANGDVKTTQTLLQDLKLTDKKGVLDSIGKHLGMFEQDNEQRRPNVNQAIQINVALES